MIKIIEIEYRDRATAVRGYLVWVLCCNNDNKTESRFFIVKREIDKHLPIIEREVKIGTMIHSDQWRAYF